MFLNILGFEYIIKPVEREDNLLTVSYTHLVGQRFENVELSSEAKKTQPPKYYTEDTLLSAMENVGRLVDLSLIHI